MRQDSYVHSMLAPKRFEYVSVDRGSKICDASYVYIRYCGGTAKSAARWRGPFIRCGQEQCRACEAARGKCGPI